jgi:serine/threonine-protein kinase
VSDRDALRERVQHAVAARFDIEEEIGRGGMAVVYRAKDQRLRRKVALKVLPPELAFRDDVKSRFLREAQMAAQLSHPHIVPIFEVDETDGVVYFAMGLVEGETLAQQLARDPKVPLPRVREILRQVAEALAYAHAQQLVHRDVKPDNILVDRATGNVLVSDFGIARAAEGDQRLTVTGIAVGTPAYMSPEQAMGEREIDGRADIYALGIVGYQMLSGTLPFEASNTPAMLMKHISERPRPLHEVRPDLPPNLVSAIERAMAKGANERWPDATAFRDALAHDAVVARPQRSHPPTAGVDYVQAPEPSRRPPALPANWIDDADAREDTRDALKEWREEQRRWRERVRGERGSAREEFRAIAQTAREDGRALLRESRGERRDRRREERDMREATRDPLDRIRAAQRQLLQTAIMIPFLFAINVASSTGGRFFPWFIFPSVAMALGVASRVGKLWLDGIPLRELFTRHPRQPGELGGGAAVALDVRVGRGAEPRRVPAIAPDLRGVDPAVLDGPHGSVVRDAAAAKATIRDVLTGLSKVERDMLPTNLEQTVNELEERVRTLAQTLHQLDADAGSESLAKLERRIAEMKTASAEAPEAVRRLELLERQRDTLKDLASRRDGVAEKLESAHTVLQTMRLDMLKLRSSGMDAKLDRSMEATQQARAVSSDISRVIEAADEARRL